MNPEDIKELTDEINNSIEELLQELVLANSPDAIVEIGIALGKSAVCRDMFKVLMEEETPKT